MTRKVACINRKNLDKTFQQRRLILKTSLASVIQHFDKIEFIEKQKLETNEKYKQIIPYTIIQNTEGQFALYKRKGNEQRLHGLWSAGFGGHIEDFENDISGNVEQLILNSAIRELKEEFSADAEYALHFEGVINEELTKVGRTHIGLVFMVTVDKHLFKPSNEIEKIEWKVKDDLILYNKELWSDMALELLLEK
jgi:predicted NUDIX family phosphoesterase